MAKALADSNADIIALQEIYEDSHVNNLLQGLKGVYPYSARMNNQHFWQFHNGLLFLSKYPIIKSETIKHKKSAIIESIMASKSMQRVEVNTPFGEMLFVNMHTTAGGYDPESKEADSIRESELAEAISICKEYSEVEGNREAIIFGDMNMGPEASNANYEYVKSSGFKDEVITALEKDGGETCTWSPENILNKGGVHNHCPPQRCDHLFLQDTSAFTVTSAQLFMKDAFITCTQSKRQSNGQTEMITLSDHYGLNVVITEK